MGLLREILNGEKASYNVLKWQIFEFFKKANFCPKKFQQDRRPVAHLQNRNFLSNTFVAYNKLYHKISIVNHCWDELIYVSAYDDLASLPPTCCIVHYSFFRLFKYFIYVFIVVDLYAVYACNAFECLFCIKFVKYYNVYDTIFSIPFVFIF